jgi:hypothetical protein
MKTDQAEELANRKKAAREEAIRRYAKDNLAFGNSADRIIVSNVFGDAYRVNFLALKGGPDEMVKAFTIINSEFIRMKVEAPEVE